MHTVFLEDGRRTMLATGVAIDVIVGTDDHPDTQAAMARVTLPPQTTLPRHDHGESDALLVPLDGRLLVCGTGGRIESLETGRVIVVPAHESVSVQNPGSHAASMLVCFAPGTFLQELSATPPAQVASGA
jgi:quercetin dioxygenase-like cupin family protein